MLHYKIDEYAIISIFLLGIMATAHLTCKAHIVRNLKAKLLVSNDVIKLK